MIVQVQRFHLLSKTADASFRFCSFNGLMSGSEDVAKGLLTSYWPDAQRLHASIQQNAESKNIDSLNKDTHTLKSSSHVIKPERFGEACHALELAAKQEDQFEGALRKFNAEHEELQQLIEQKL